MNVLIDSSIWIDYFRGTGDADTVDHLIDENLIATNELILSELIPVLQVRNQKRLVSLLKNIRCIPLSIDWEDLRQIQVACIRNGINGVGIPDIIIAQNAIQNRLHLFSSDGHFGSISEITRLMTYH